MTEEASAVWVCRVCGYTHHGAEPPAECPVCGAAKDEFEPLKALPRAAAPSPKAWRCVICGYLHEGPAPPEDCPVCGATADEFEPYAVPEPVSVTRSASPLRLVIVGAGIAGIAAAEAARETSPDSEITVVSDDAPLPYYRLNLSRYLANEIGVDALPIHPHAWYADKRIRLLSGQKVRAIEPDAKAIVMADGSRVPCDRLLLTCGAHPFVPPIPGAVLEGATAFRTIEDAELLLRYATAGSAIVCIGGGILGLETAGGLAKRGATVTVLEGFDWLLPRQLDPEAAGMLERHAAGLGIRVRYGAKVAAIEGDAHVQCVRLDDGSTLAAACVAITTGVRANTHLARSAGISVNQGVVVDARMATSADGVFAAGDVAEFQGVTYGLWEPARLQGIVAGTNAAGGHAEFAPVPRANTLKVLGLDMFSVGVVMPGDGSYTVIRGRGEGTYSRYVFHEGRLAGAVLMGDTRRAAQAAAAVRDRRDATSLLRKNADSATVADWLRDG